MVEQRTENPCVGGSSPPLGTKRKLSCQRVFCVIINYNHRTYAFGVSGVALKLAGSIVLSPVRLWSLSNAFANRLHSPIGTMEPAINS